MSLKRSPMPLRAKPMARGEMRRTGFTSAPSEMKRTGRLRYRSAKTEKVYREQRRPLVAELLEQFPFCQIQWDDGCQLLSVDVHELLSRGRGGSITDKGNCVTGCRYCHNRVGENPAEAERRGFLLKSGRPSKAVPRG